MFTRYTCMFCKISYLNEGLLENTSKKNENQPLEDFLTQKHFRTK